MIVALFAPLTVAQEPGDTSAPTSPLWDVFYPESNQGFEGDPTVIESTTGSDFPVLEYDAESERLATQARRASGGQNWRSIDLGPLDQPFTATFQFDLEPGDAGDGAHKYLFMGLSQSDSPALSFGALGMPLDGIGVGVTTHGDFERREGVFDGIYMFTVHVDGVREALSPRGEMTYYDPLPQDRRGDVFAATVEYDPRTGDWDVRIENTARGEVVLSKSGTTETGRVYQYFGASTGGGSSKWGGWRGWIDDVATQMLVTPEVEPFVPLLEAVLGPRT